MGNKVLFCSLQAFQQPPPGETPASLPHDLCPRPGQGAASHRHVRRVHQDVQRVDPRVELHLVEAQKRVKRKLSEKELFLVFVEIFFFLLTMINSVVRSGLGLVRGRVALVRHARLSNSVVVAVDLFQRRSLSHTR